MPHKISFHRQQFCTKCAVTTRWELCEGGLKYQCVGDDQRHPERKAHGCGRIVEATAFHVKHHIEGSLE